MSITATRPDTAAVVADLRARITGEVLVPTDAAYDEARLGFNRAFVSSPAVVVVVGSTADVAEAVRAAAVLDLPVAVQATGHGPGPSADGSLLIVTSRLTAVTIDPVAATARVAAGTKWGPVLAAAQEHGLAPLLGSTTDVGVVGYTLGGGMGWLARHHGLASDSVLAFELVTPAGQEIRTSADEHPELFWALRGGGAGSLGVVTAVELRLVEVSTVYAGNLFYPVEAARDVHRFFAEWTADLDEEMTSSVAVMNFPPLPEIPEPMRGRSFAIVRGAYSGDDLERGRELVDRWRAWRAPEIDLFGPMPFAQADMISMDPVDPMPVMVATESFDALTAEVSDAILDAAVPSPAGPPLLLMAEVRHAGGAMRRGAAGAVNDRGRSAEYVLALGGLAMGPDMTAALVAELERVRGALAPHATGAPYLNFLEGEARRERAADAFGPEQLARLRRVKREIDPDGRFDLGFGIGTEDL